MHRHTIFLPITALLLALAGNLLFPEDVETKILPALAHARRAVLLHPEGASGHNNLGVVLAARGEWEAAAAPYARAAGLRPETCCGLLRSNETTNTRPASSVRLSE